MQPFPPLLSLFYSEQSFVFSLDGSVFGVGVAFNKLWEQLCNITVSECEGVCVHYSFTICRSFVC